MEGDGINSATSSTWDMWNILKLSKTKSVWQESIYTRVIDYAPTVVDMVDICQYATQLFWLSNLQDGKSI